MVISRGALRAARLSALWEAVYEFVSQRRLKDKGLFLLTKGAIAQEFKDFLETNGYTWDKSNVKSGDMVFNMPGILVYHSFELKEDRLSYTTRYMQIYSNGTLENSANYDDIVKSHNLREIPRDP